MNSLEKIQKRAKQKTLKDFEEAKENFFVKSIPVLNKDKEKELIKKKQELFFKLISGIETNLLIDSKVKAFLSKIQKSNYKVINKIIKEMESSLKDQNNDNSFFKSTLPANCEAVFKKDDSYVFAIEESPQYRTISTRGKKYFRVPIPKCLFLIKLRKQGNFYRFSNASLHFLKGEFSENSILYDSKIPHCLRGGAICLGGERRHLKNFKNPQEAIQSFFEVFWGGVFVYEVNFSFLNSKLITSYQDWSKLDLENMKKLSTTQHGKVQDVAQVMLGNNKSAVTNNLRRILDKNFLDIIKIQDLKNEFDEIFQSLSKTIQ